MNGKLKDVAFGLCSLAQMACVIGIAGIALKRNNDCYKAECKLIDSEHKHILAQMDGLMKDIEIAQLTKENERLKAKCGEEES